MRAGDRDFMTNWTYDDGLLVRRIPVGLRDRQSFNSLITVFAQRAGPDGFILTLNELDQGHPVNMVGFVAANTLRGDLELWHASDHPDATEGARIIDVRGPDEYAVWHLAGAENVPLKELRRQQVDWDRTVPIRLYCAVGFRNYLAYRSLVQRGFTDVKTLFGGSRTFRAFPDVAPSEIDAPLPITSYAEDAPATAPRRRAPPLQACWSTWTAQGRPAPGRL